MAPEIESLRKLEFPEEVEDKGHNGNNFWDNGFGDFDGAGLPEDQPGADAARTGLWVALGAIVMLFAALLSAMVVRKGLGKDWVPTALPHILYLNTFILLLSSLTLEFSRHWLKIGIPSGFISGLCLSLALGLGFIAGQLAAWRELALKGVFLATNPSSSFFYVLTAAHGLHLLGGIAALVYVTVRARRIAFGIQRPLAFELTAAYWHFLDGLWLCLFITLITAG